MADGTIIHLTDETFDDAVAEGVILVDMWAPWCGPCMMQGPILEKLAAAFGDKARIAKLNVDEGQLAAARLGVHSIPTLILFDHGDEVTRFIGVQSEAVLASALKDVLKA